MTLDLYRLEQLIAVAEEGSVTRAAARLHLSQQALSTSLRNLEREVGVELLDRSGPGVRMLPAGEALLADARVLRGLARSALRTARRIGRGELDVLRIGHTPAVTGEEIGEILRAVRSHHPGLRIEPHSRYPPALADELIDGHIDVGLCRAMLPVHGLARTTVTRHRLSVAVAEEHPLAARDSVSFDDLADETIIVWGSPGRSGYTDLLISVCRQAGLEPRTTRTDLQGVPPVHAVIGTSDVAFVTATPGWAADGAVRILALTPPTSVPLIGLWPRHVTSEARDAFLSTMRELAGDE